MLGQSSSLLEKEDQSEEDKGNRKAPCSWTMSRNPDTSREAFNVPWQRIEVRRRLPQLWQQQQRMQHRADDIRRDARLVVLHDGKVERHDSRILHQNVQSLQPLRTLREVLDRLIVRQIELPHFGNARPSCGFLDGFLRRLALFEVADGEDNFGGVETHEVAGRFETEAGIAACDDDGLAGVLFGGVRGDGEKLGAQECDGRLHVRHLGG